MIRRRSAAGARPRARSSAPATLESDADRDLFEALRARRRELAKANGLAPFMVFPDRTLIELALKKPRHLASLGAIHGIGQAKRDRWGEDVLAVIRRFAGDAGPLRRPGVTRSAVPAELTGEDPAGTVSARQRSRGW